MKTYKTVDEYLQHFKVNDIIVFAGYGIIDGIKSIEYKYDTVKVHLNTTKDKIVFTNYRGRKTFTLGANYYDQQVAVLTEKEFNNLKS
jgi:hypothetical protein